MTSSRDQVILLTRGINLPLKPLGPVQLSVLAEAVCIAWKEAIAAVPNGLARREEGWINFDIIVRLTKVLQGPRNTTFATLVSEVHKGVEQPNFNGTTTEKRPDINFILTNGTPGFPFVGECKIIDRKKGQTVGKYGRHGIERFVDGRYAWFNTQAVMIAYVRDGTACEPAIAKLTKLPTRRHNTRTHSYIATDHVRRFAYIDRVPEVGSPGSITIVHIWLEAPALPPPPSPMP